MSRLRSSCRAVWLAIVLSLSAPLIALTGSPVHAVEPNEVLADPALEARARDLSAGLRCMVCQNQSIDDSNAGLAKDLRVLVRERLVAGDTDEEVIDYLVSRYGQFVLLQPRFEIETIVLWATPLAVLAVGCGYAFVTIRRRRKGDQPAAAKLSEDEEKRLAAVMKNG